MNFCSKIQKIHFFFLTITCLVLIGFVLTPHALSAQTLRADANNDGVVDGADYLIWVNHYELTTLQGKLEGDFNNDTQVNGLDFVIFLQNYGPAAQTPSITPTATPTSGQVELGNIALHKTVTASSHDTDAPDPNAVTDGDTTTRWSSAWSQPEWVQIDLGRTYTVSRVVLNWQRSYGQAYRIETSADGSTWNTIFTTTTGDGGIDNLTNVNGTGRYIRMYGTQRACDACGGKLYGFSLWEFEVYTTSTGTTSTPTPIRTGTVTPTPTKTPTPAVTGTTVCFVKVAGVIYNMQPAIGIKLTDPNTQKTHTHSISNFKCGTLAAPTDMTTTYLGKHLKMGCAPRLAPYIYTPPAPDDPTCQ